MPFVLLSSIVSFLIGIWLGSYFPFVPISIIIVLILIAWVCTYLERSGVWSFSQSLLLYVCLLVGVVYWNVWDGSAQPSEILKVAGEEEVLITGTIAEPVQHAPGRLSMMVRAQTIGEKGKRENAEGMIRLTWREPNRELYRGDLIEVRTRLRAPFGTRNLGGFDYGAYLRQHGIDAVALIRGPDQVVVHSREGWSLASLLWGRIDQWRNRIRQVVLSSLSDPASGLFLGMIIGEQHFLDQNVRDDFMTTGTVHIISISGSHLGLLAFLSFLSIRVLSRRMPAPWLERLSCWVSPKQVAAVVTIPVVVFYTVISGSHIATVRSLIMILLYLVAVWFGHERQILTALAVAALLTTIVDPQVVYDLSFQFSYVSVLALALALKWTSRTHDSGLEDRASLRAQIKTWSTQYLTLTCAVTLASLPLVAYYFNQVAWMGIVANMMVVPFVGLFIVPLGLFSSILTLVFDLNSLPLSGLNEMFLHGLAKGVSVLANMPGAEWHVASPSLLAMAAFYIAFFGICLTHKRMIRCANAVVLTMLVVWWVWSPRQVFDGGTFRVTFLDVGQGDATVVELPQGQTVLVDGGAAYERWNLGRTVVGPYLWDRGIRRIDHVIATHPQRDHVGGLGWVLAHFDIGNFWTNGVSRREPFYQGLTQAVKEKGLNPEMAWAGRMLYSGETCRIQSLNPPEEFVNRRQGHNTRLVNGEGFNNLSVVLSVRCGPQSVLLPADAEIAALERIMSAPLVRGATLVKIPHHGAKSSLSQNWIDHLTAKIAVVSAGKRNPYGHPVPAVIDAYTRRGISVYRTDLDGAVVVIYEEDSWEPRIQTARAQVLIPVDLNEHLFDQERENLRRLWKTWIGIG